ncbi:methyl-accepting chemotaxis protein [Synechocystis sp. PCC 7509]|uniref:methyl-accepting chemotaxis protein n=1 Tax=Synechocystis sp. PCC 7509 TaxID=927677 RepID=UPI0002AC0133|nr:HAMP domain-containing methyl-accepting chemotaxis protein [Synechocystis sp. PCC 7509]
MKTTNHNIFNTTSQDIESLIKSLQEEVELDPSDLVSKISLATVLEQSNRNQEAKSLYQEVVDADSTGSMGAIALKALETLDLPQSGLLEPSKEITESGLPLQDDQQELSQPKVTRRKKKKSPIQWFYNLPISRKQLIALLASEILSVIALGMGSKYAIETGLRSQLLNQASSEVAVTEINYNIKVNQMGFGFRGQSDNSAIVSAAKAAAENKPISQPLRSQVDKILKNEITARKIEYATLVGKDLRIIVGANANRQGEVFNPNNLVKEIFSNQGQIKANAIVKWSELQKENPPLPAGFAYRDALIRYTVTAVKDPVTKQVIGALVSGDIVNGKLPIVKDTLKALDGGYSAIYAHKPATKDFSVVAALDQGKASIEQAVPNTTLQDLSLLEAAVKADGKTVTSRLKVGSQIYTLAAIALPNVIRENGSVSLGKENQEPVAILVRGTRENAVDELLEKSVIQGFTVLILAVVIITAWAMILRRAIPKPIENLRQTAQEFSAGDRTARAEIFATDEIGQLAMTFNQMADSVNASATALEEQSRLRQAEADFQRQEKESLQQGVIAFLLDIEDAQQGNLTVKAKVDEGAIGSIADAFNTTIRSLREIVTQVKAATSQVQASTFSSESSVAKLSTEATTQAQSVNQALNSVEEIGQSIQSVADSAQKAAAIARQAVEAAKEGGETMDLTVGSIQNIRSSVAETSKKVKRLAESSQEISKVVSIISGISEKTNLLAFNASIEAARAGEHGQGFRVVADEVRRLAERVTDSTKEIEQLVNTIQQETAEVLQTMEASTTQVVTGTQLVGKTKLTLEGLANISNTIDELLQSISASTVSQTIASQTVNQNMHEVAAIALNTSQESEAVSVSLKQLVGVAEELQNSVSRFQVEK